MKQKALVDQQFYIDLQNSGPLGPLLFAPVMYTAVRLFGDSWLTEQLGAVWGYGWR